MYAWTSERKTGQWLDAAALVEGSQELRASAGLVWIDLENPSEEEELLVLQQFFPVHPLTLEDISKPRRDPDALPHFPKVEEFPDYLFVIVNPLRQQVVEAIRKDGTDLVLGEGRMATQLSGVLSEKVLITHHVEPLSSVQALKDFLARHQTQCDRGPDYLFHLVLDAMVDQYAEVLDHFTDVLDDQEVQVLNQPTPTLLATLLRLKRRIIQVRKGLVYEREVLARLARGEFDLIDEREMVYYRNVLDHLVRFTELIESSREMVSDLMQTHLAAASNRLNEIMKVLTMISTVVLPMTLIAGVYGMNFDHMPEIKWVFGYPFALALMLAVGGGAFLYFRWKKWI